jgi:ribosomal subunit interface protein
MRIWIRSIHVPVTEAMRHHIERALSASLQRRAHELGEVRVRLRDLNGPKGGVDQEVLVIGHARGRTLSARAVDSDAYVALTSAIERVARRLSTRGRRHGERR